VTIFPTKVKLHPCLTSTKSASTIYDDVVDHFIVNLHVFASKLRIINTILANIIIVKLHNIYIAKLSSTISKLTTTSTKLTTTSTKLIIPLVLSSLETSLSCLPLVLS
jgi:hypothetical protein